ncbi:NAD(P)H-dependent oxidoreductase [Zunongwangia sp. F363]|uniref:NAD(P)H-dependent oxidoreductase n=1 Tax=Autumnicola tepida TaxID=3075595 RepID=A0ABU3C816_9FLAO|nr:NAD(P)H-dependent oxidoreductase [Zunongwangia sp. F363]MDT0642488.1 NAD(P)H-dependent oxidoreductase [Zunongwangia sp. F363]
MDTYIENLEWRYATKKFDQTRKIEAKDLEKLLKSIQLSASSYGMQPYEVLVVKDPEMRQKLQPVAFNQSQITEASHLIVFASLTSISEEHVDAYLDNISKIRDIQVEKLNGFKDMLANTVLKQSASDQKAWAEKQAYIALGNLLSAAANYKIDACPMEGFDAVKFNEILGLKEKGLSATVIATIGYRSEKDVAQHAKKVRKNEKQLFHHI